MCVLCTWPWCMLGWMWAPLLVACGSRVDVSSLLTACVRTYSCLCAVGVVGVMYAMSWYMPCVCVLVVTH